MIPVTLVTGFLGSGKTSFLEHVIATHAEGEIAYLVNEFSPRDIDGSRIELSEEQLITVSGGSIFCRCKVTDFINGLNRLAELSPAPRAVVIEASGIADPRVMRKMLAETKLDLMFRVANVICLIDAGTFSKLFATWANIRAQLESASLILLNKTDIYDEAARAEVRAKLAALKVKAPLIETTFGRADIDLFCDSSIGKKNGEYAKCVDPNFEQVEVTFHAPVNWDILRAEISKISPVLYRAKGFVPTCDGVLYVDFASDNWHERRSKTARCHAGLVIIFDPTEVECINRLTGRIISGAFAA